MKNYDQSLQICSKSRINLSRKIINEKINSNKKNKNKSRKKRKFCKYLIYDLRKKKTKKELQKKVNKIN